jgi:hypothetical protein
MNHRLPELLCGMLGMLLVVGLSGATHADACDRYPAEAQTCPNSRPATPPCRDVWIICKPLADGSLCLHHELPSSQSAAMELAARLRQRGEPAFAMRALPAPRGMTLSDGHQVVIAIGVGQGRAVAVGQQGRIERLPN